MAANIQDAIVLLGDSLTQGGYEFNGFAARLARTFYLPIVCYESDTDRTDPAMFVTFPNHNLQWEIGFVNRRVQSQDGCP